MSIKSQKAIDEIFKKFQPKTETINLFVISKYDFEMEPYYQRNVVWEQPYQTTLINSIMRNIPINAIHLVVEPQADGGEKFIVLDGKQRLTAIQSFMNNEIQIKISFKDYPEKEFKYKEILSISEDKTDARNNQAKKIINDFTSYSIMVVKWPSMTLQEQSKIFDVINMSKELTKDERFLAKYFYSKVFTKFFMDNYFPSLSEKSSSKKDKRSKDLIWGLRLLYIMFDGADGVDSGKFRPNIERIHKVSYDLGFENFAKQLHFKIEKYISDYSKTLVDSFESKSEMDKMLSVFKWSTSLKEMSKFLEDVGNKIIPTKISGANNISGWILTYFTAFIISKYSENIITHNSFTTDLEKYKKFFASYLEWIKEPGLRDERTRRFSDKQTFGNHINKLNSLFKELGLDYGIKYPKPDVIDELHATVNSFGKCEVCKTQLSNENIQIDHLKPASLNSDPGTYGALCKECNRRKSDNNLNSLNEIANYIDKKSSEIKQ